MTVVGVVGSGTMGAGIVQVALEAGDDVVLFDIDPTSIGRARDRVRDGLKRRAASIQIDDAAIDGWVDLHLDRLRSAVTLQALAGEAEIVIEAVLEDLGVKRATFRALDGAAQLTTILATNTSALSVGAIASATAHPQRVVGLHFFNPVPLMALVEVVVTESVARSCVERAEALARRWGRTTVRCADTPGFIVNRVNRPFTIQALRMLEDGEASVVAIDDAMRAGGFPMGPFALMDLVGIDVNLAAATAIWEGLARPERLRPSPIQARLVADARLGRKTGSGFYRYVDGVSVGVEADIAGPSVARLSPDLIRERIVRAIEEEARNLVHDGIATAADIDLALRLGAGHPRRTAPGAGHVAGGATSALRSMP
ncbi:MAG: 3-hydroxyacyl-CoA dehydrogenase NAD-binding domain-containing protein [Candidatus Limnocylindrales bacterium]